MDLQWMWQGVVTELLGAALIFVVGAVLTYLHHKESQWTTSILYGLVGSALITVLLWAFTGFVQLYRQHQQITLDNIETNIRGWLDHMAVTVRKQDDSAACFLYIVTLDNHIPVIVKREKKWEYYIIFQTVMTVPQELQPMLNSLYTEEVTRVKEEIILELARLNVQWNVSQFQLQQIALDKLVPITSSLTEAVFAERLREMVNAYALADTRLRLSLRAARQSP